MLVSLVIVYVQLYLSFSAHLKECIELCRLLIEVITEQYRLEQILQFNADVAQLALGSQQMYLIFVFACNTIV